MLVREKTIFNPPGQSEAGTQVKINLRDPVANEKFDF